MIVASLFDFGEKMNIINSNSFSGANMFVITIDGLAGCGKSTIAQGLSERLRFKRLNTGAIYRGIACQYLEQFGETKPNEKIIAQFLKTLSVKVVFVDGVQNVVVNGTNFTEHLREERVSVATPFISGYDELREKVREIQRAFAQANDCIVEGRDIGRIVLPNAQCKFFLKASIKARAERRFEQMKNDENHPTLEKIKEDIAVRDEMDKNREFGAMLPADDAIIIDNSNETVEQTLSRCEKIIEEKRKL
jgi:cytidylate kinase